MALGEIILTVTTAGTLAIGAICFFIVYTTFQGIDNKEIHEFSRRYLMSIAVLILYVSYQMLYNTALTSYSWAKFPLYFILSLVFIILIYATIGFEQLAEKYGISEQKKLERMENEELG
ncbi:MAG: hypothetical protein ABEJ83_00745 [Candidatus Nanohaloarchaea archaeon]